MNLLALTAGAGYTVAPAAARLTLPRPAAPQCAVPSPWRYSMKTRRAMNLKLRRTFTAGALLWPLVVQDAMAQRGGAWVRFFLQPAVSLAQLEEVQQDLKLDDKQKQVVVDLNAKLNDDRMALFQDAGGDREKIRQGIAKLYQDVTAKFNESLDEKQQKRAREIYLQVNGPVALQDEQLAAELKLSDEQKEKLEQARDASRSEFMNAGLRDLTEEEAAKKVDELIKSRDDKLLAVLNDEQRKAFEQMCGEKLEVDLSKMPMPGR
jgi:Spy/CpxP family protein refolding chaperone